MAKNIFEPVEPISQYIDTPTEYQVNIDPVSDIDESAPTEQPTESSRRRLIGPQALFIICMLVLGWRLFQLQVGQAAAYQVLAKGNRIESRAIVPPRGLVVDRLGRSLVQNVPAYQLEVYPPQLPKDKAVRKDIYTQLAGLVGIGVDDVVKQVEAHGFYSLEPLVLKDGLRRDQALEWQVKLGFIAGVSINQLPNRLYTSGDGLGHLLGYIGKVNEQDLAQRSDLGPTSFIGKTGLEASYDSQLQGVEGKSEMEVDSKGQIQRLVASEPAEPGHTLKLFLNEDLQKVMADALQEGITKAGRKKGVAIAMDPQTGGILGMVSLPNYDDNAFVPGSPSAKDRQSYLTNPDQPLFDRAISGSYPPGSTSKPIWASAGLQEGVITEKTDILTPAEIKVGASTFPDWKYHEHANVKKAIAESNNIFFYAVAGGFDSIKGLGANRMKDYANRFGWGNLTGIDLPGEAKGLVPDPDWKKKFIKESWYIGDTYHEGIGQGYLSLTPIQLINSISAIANGGTLYSPRLVQQVLDVDGKVVASPGSAVIRDKIVDEANLSIVRAGMRQTVTDGSARPLNDLPIQVAGKTGTAQFEEIDKTHAWFVGFAPYDKPTISLLVMVEGGGESFTVAVPIAKQILSWYSEHVTDFTDPTKTSE